MALARGQETAQGAAGGALGDDGGQHRAPHNVPEDGHVQVVAPALAGQPVHADAWRGRPTAAAIRGRRPERRYTSPRTFHQIETTPTTAEMHSTSVTAPALDRSRDVNCP